MLWRCQRTFPPKYVARLWECLSASWLRKDNDSEGCLSKGCDGGRIFSKKRSCRRAEMVMVNTSILMKNDIDWDQYMCVEDVPKTELFCFQTLSVSTKIVGNKARVQKNLLKVIWLIVHIIYVLRHPYPCCSQRKVAWQEVNPLYVNVSSLFCQNQGPR